MDRLRHRADFLRCARTVRRVAPGLTLEAAATLEKQAKPNTLRVGFTATRKIGGAVERNLAKRRLRAAAAALLPLYGQAGRDYVLVGRAETLRRPFGLLRDDLAVSLEAVHARLARMEQPS
jgi:ribonuclease P protein component